MVFLDPKIELFKYFNDKMNMIDSIVFNKSFNQIIIFHT